MHCCAWHSGRYVSCFFCHHKEGRRGECPDRDHPGKSLGLLIDLTEIRFPCSQDSHWVDLGKEWKNHWHYVANATSMGDNIYVHDLDDDEFNDLLDSGAFIYDPSRNPFDKGRLLNCLNFWCQARWTSDAQGEF